MPFIHQETHPLTLYICRVDEIEFSTIDFNQNDMNLKKGPLIELYDERRYKGFDRGRFCVPEAYQTEMLEIAKTALIHGKRVKVALESTEDFSEIVYMSLTNASVN